MNFVYKIVVAIAIVLTLTAAALAEKNARETKSKADAGVEVGVAKQLDAKVKPIACLLTSWSPVMQPACDPVHWRGDVATWALNENHVLQVPICCPKE